MPSYTTNLNLEKPLQTEGYDVDVFNGNADLIDAAVGGLESGVEEVNTALAQKSAKARRYTAAFASTGWSAEAPYTQSVSVSGILATDVPIADIVIQSEDEEGMAAETEAYGLITKIDTGAGTVTATAAEEAPTADITVQLVVWDINDMTGGA